MEPIWRIPDEENVAVAYVVNELRFLWQGKAFTMSPIDCNAKSYEDKEGTTKIVNKRLGRRRTRRIAGR